MKLPADTPPLPDSTPDEELARAIDEHQRELALRWTSLQDGFVLDREDELLTIVGEPVPWVNGVHAARLEPDQVEERIAEAVATFREHGVPGMWWVGPTTRPPGIAAALERNGFRQGEVLPWLRARAAEVGDGAAPPELRAMAVDGPVEQVLWVIAMARGFGMGHAEQRVMNRLSAAVGHDDGYGWLRFLGLVEERPVCSAGLMLGAGLASVVNVATAPEFRRRGYATAMVRFAARRAAELGYELVVLSAAPGAAGVYEAMGFRQVCTVTEYVWEG